MPHFAAGLQWCPPCSAAVAIFCISKRIHPRFQEAIGRIEALLHTGERLVSGTAREFDDGQAVDPDHARLSRNNPLERHYRDVLCARIHAPQPDSILVRAGRNSLGY